MLSREGRSLASAPILTRRGALRGAASAALGLGAASAVSAVGHASLSANDARLVALADEYEMLDRAVNATPSSAPGFDAMVRRYTDLEVEAAETPADSMAGVAAKARLCQSPAARGCADYEHILSAIDDLHRLLSAGARHA